VGRFKDKIPRNPHFLNTSDSVIEGSQGKAETLGELKLIFEAAIKTGLPKSIQKPVNVRGRPSWNRFILLSVMIYGLQHGFSYRDMERFCKENQEFLKSLDPAWKGVPDHVNFYLIAKKLRVADVIKITSKVKDLRGELPCLWY
jgi:hypothetical protein